MQTFFQNIAQYTQGMDLTLSIRAINDELTISLLPRSTGKESAFPLIPLVLKGSAQQLDENFFLLLETCVTKTPEILSSIAMFESFAEKQKAASEEKLRAKKEVKKDVAPQADLFSQAPEAVQPARGKDEEEQPNEPTI